MNKLVKTVARKDLYFEFISSLNGILQLTNREMELMAFIIDLHITNSKLPTSYSRNVISAENRKYITATLGISKDNLSRYISKFKEKGLILKGKADDEWYVNPIIVPEIIGDRVLITIILRIKNETQI